MSSAGIANLKSSVIFLLQNDSDVQTAVHEAAWEQMKPFRDNVNAFFLILMAIHVHGKETNFLLKLRKNHSIFTNSYAVRFCPA